MGVVERLRSTRLDAALAAALIGAALVQLVVVPFAAPAVGVLYVLGSMLPLAWRRTFPVESALVSSALWLVPVEGYPVLGFVAVVLQFFALGDRGRPIVLGRHGIGGCGPAILMTCVVALRRHGSPARRPRRIAPPAATPVRRPRRRR